MKQTKKLSLKLFEGTDKFDYKVINENCQKIDDAFNVVLFEDANGVTEGKTIEFEPGNYNLFAVTLKFNEAYQTVDGVYHLETTILCTREIQTGRGAATDWNAGEVNKFISGQVKLGYNKSALVRIDYKNKVVEYTAYFNDEALSNSTRVKGLITKIVGLM